VSKDCSTESAKGGGLTGIEQKRASVTFRRTGERVDRSKNKRRELSITVKEDEVQEIPRNGRGVFGVSRRPRGSH